MDRILYIINPVASGGAGSNAWKRFRSQWPNLVDPKDIRVAERPGHATEIAASSEGYEILAAVGGDGTVGEILSGIMEHQEPRPKFALIPAGTSNDVARHVGIFSVEDAMAALIAKHTRMFDIFRVDCKVDGQPAHRYAFMASNVGFFAVSLSFLKPWMKRLLGQKGAHYLCMLMGVATYQPPHMTVLWEDQEYSGRTWKVLVGNVEWTLGGRLRIAPGARTDDGELNVTIVPFKSKVNILLKLPKISKGSLINERDILYFPVTRIDVNSDPPVCLEIDGDLIGTTPATFTVCPRAVQIVSPTPSNGETT